jgi:hypothetical protein
MARKGCGPYNLGAPKTIAKQLKGNVAGPSTEEESKKNRKIGGPMVDQANENIQQRHAAFEKAKAKGAQPGTDYDSDGNERNYVEFNNQRYYPGDQNRRQQRAKAIKEGKYDNWETGQRYNNKHSYDYKNNVLNVTNPRTGDKKVKQNFDPKHSANRDASGAYNPSLSQRGQLGNRDKALYDQSKGNYSSRESQAAQSVIVEHKTDSIGDAHGAQSRQIVNKALNSLFPPSPNNKLSSAFKMQGFMSKAIGKKYKK